LTVPFYRGHYRNHSVLVEQVQQLYPGAHIFFDNQTYDHHALVIRVEETRGDYHFFVTTMFSYSFLFVLKQLKYVLKNMFN